MNRLALFLALFAFWVLLTWPAELPGAAYWEDLAVGLAAAVLVAWLVGDAAAEGPGRWLQPGRYGWALVYLFVLAAFVVKANLDVAYRVLHPALPIRPGIVKIRTRLRTSAARTVLSNSITLTPGTLAVDLHEDGVMLVHWICVRSEDEQEAARQIIGRFEWFIEKIFE